MSRVTITTLFHPLKSSYAAVSCSVLQWEVVSCSVVQRVAARCRESQYPGNAVSQRHVTASSKDHQLHASFADTLQHAATRCNTLQHAATRCNTLQHAVTPCNTLQQTLGICKDAFADDSLDVVEDVLETWPCCVT